MRELADQAAKAKAQQGVTAEGSALSEIILQ
jgi:hypothetical protein